MSRVESVAIRTIAGADAQVILSQRRKASRKLMTSILTHGAIILILLFVVFPFYWALVSTLKPSTKLYTIVPTFIPDPFTLENYIWAFSQDTFVKTLRNSIIVSLVTPIFALILTSMFGYSLARFNYPGKKVILTILVATQMLPGILMIVPLFVVFVTIQKIIQIPLVNSYAGLVIGFATFAVPFSALLLRGFFSGIPIELEEAALIDGCNRLQAFLRVILPLSIPGVLTVGLFAFVQAWNDLLFAMVITSNTKAMTVSVQLTQLATSQYSNTNYGGILAEGVIITVPVVIIFVFLQKYLIEGMTAGAVKG
jgi:multiple sugar transport system permease protein